MYGDAAQVQNIIKKNIARAHESISKNILLTEDWLFFSSFYNLDTVRISDIVWAYRAQTSHRRNFIETHKTFSLELRLYEDAEWSFALTEFGTIKLLQAIQRKAPWIPIGYSEELNNLWITNRSRLYSMANEMRKASNQENNPKLRPQKNGWHSIWMQVGACVVAAITISANLPVKAPVNKGEPMATGSSAKVENPLPKKAILDLANGAFMTDLGKNIFFSKNPQIILDKKELSQVCVKRDSSHTENPIIFGCLSDKIYLFQISDRRLKGMMNATAAHEMLHEAYQRLSEDERRWVDQQMLNEALKVRSDIRERLNTLYSIEQKSSELHSILATEVVQLPESLENYYSQYFSDRKSLVRLARSLDIEVAIRKKEIKKIESVILDLKARIAAQDAEISVLTERINKARERLNSLAESGEIERHNNLVPEVNAFIELYKTALAEHEKYVKKYNDLIGKRNSLALDIRDLFKKIDSRISTIADRNPASFL